MTGNNRNTQAGQKGHAKRQNKKKNNNQSNNMPKSKASVNVGKVVQMSTMLSLMQANANHRPINNKVVTLTGSDFLGRVSATAEPSTVSKAIRKTFPISPSAYPGTRITQLAELWERYRFKKFAIRYVPSVPNTLACQFLLYQDTDPLDDPSLSPDVDALIRQGVTQTGSQQWNFNASKVINLAKRADKELYYTGLVKQNERFNYQGTAYLVQVTDAIDFNGSKLSQDLDCGSLYIDWECEFQTAQVNPEVIAQRQPISPIDLNFTTTEKTFNVPTGYTGILVPDLYNISSIDSSGSYSSSLYVDDIETVVLGGAGDTVSSASFRAPQNLTALSAGDHTYYSTTTNANIDFAEARLFYIPL